MNRYKYVLFDLDGTLTDSAPGIINSIEYALNIMNIPVENKEELRMFVGPPLHDALKSVYELSTEDATRTVDLFRENYATEGVFNNSAFQGIDKVLSQLVQDGRILAVATSKPDFFAKQVLERFELLKYFQVVSASNFEETKGDKVDIINAAINELGISSLDDVVMVGDRKYDINAANAIGIDSIGVLFGYGSREEFNQAGATYVADDMSHLAGLLGIEEINYGA